MFRKKKQSNVPGIVVNGQQTGEANGGTQPMPVTPKPAQPRLLIGKKPLLVSGALLAVALTVAAAGIWYQRSADNGGDTNDGQEYVATPADEASQKAGGSYNPETGEGYQDAIAVLDEGLSKVDGDKEESAFLHLNKASVYMNAKRYDQAREEGRQAESLYPTIASAAFIANASKELGDKAEAAKYYQLAIDRTKAQEGYNQTDLKHYEDLLKGVQ